MNPPSRSATSFVAASLVSLALILPAQAALFTDVPDGSAYQGAVEGLTLLHIVNGYPDGTYGPRKPVNRAEFLTLLFRAAHLTADEGSRLCFKDVEAGSWYEHTVCSALTLGIVKGYDDGTFKPNKEVSRGEAAKIIVTAFGLSLDGVNATSIAKTLSDIPADRWDAPYLQLLVERGVLPLPGQAGAAYHSDWPLIRGDAALMIWSMLQSLQRLPISSSSSSVESSSSSVQSSSVASSSSATTSSSVASSVSSRSSSVSSASPDTPTIENITLPYSGEGTVSKGRASVYRFSFKATKTITVTVKGGMDALTTPTCRLFKLGSGGISNEYYFGTVSAGSCLMRVTLGSGDYQLEVNSNDHYSGYSIAVAEGKSDGNDGFSQAAALSYNGPVIRGSLLATDYGQYYKFKVTVAATMRLDQQSDAGTLKCLVFPGDDVELESFSGPTCNADYKYPVGTYTVWIGHDPAGLTRHTFSLSLH